MFTFILDKPALPLPATIGVTRSAFMLVRMVPGDPLDVRVGERRLGAAIDAAVVPWRKGSK